MNSSLISNLLTHLINGSMTDDLLLNIDESVDSDLKKNLLDLRSQMYIQDQTCQRMDAIFNSSPQPILITNDVFQIKAVNPSFLKISGFSIEELLYNPLERVIPQLYKAAMQDLNKKDDEISEFLTIDFPAGRRVLDQYTIRVPTEMETANEIVLIFKDITIRISAEEEAEKFRQKLLHDYGERVKEQKLFYSTASLIQDNIRSSGEVLADIVSLIPPGWQYPEITAAAIQYGSDIVATENYRETPWIQKAQFLTQGNVEGSITVAYLEDRNVEYEGVFLLEERNLINSLAEMLKTFLDRKENEKELATRMHDLGERVKEQRLFYSTASLIQDDSKEIPEVLQRISELIPPGWQYPDITAAQITYGNETGKTSNYSDTLWKQDAQFITKSGGKGVISVVYLEAQKSEFEGPFLLEERNLINSLAEMLKTFIDRKENEQELATRMHDLGERVKEQRLFYSTASLIQDDSKDVPEVLSSIAELIPPGWQYPEITAARISYGTESTKTKNYQDTLWKQDALFRTRSGTEGVISVVYLEEKKKECEGPFLLEERNLINSLAEMLKAYIDRKEGEKELEVRIQEIEELEHLNNTIVQQIPMPVILVDKSQQILVTNDAYITLSGFTREKLLGMNPKNIKVLAHSGEGLRELLSDRRTTYGELTIEFPVGIRTLEQYGIPIFNRSGALENFLIVYNDVTSRKEKEEEVAQLLSDARSHSEILAQSAQELENAMAKLAGGDLTRLTEISRADPLGSIKEDYNIAITAITTVLKELEDSIDNLRGAAGETLTRTEAIRVAISGVSDRVQGSTTGARNQLTQTLHMTEQVRSLSYSVEEIGKTVGMLLEKAELASSQGEDAKVLGGIASGKMESVGTISAHSMDQITDLNTRMQEIDKIVRMISDISSQTNLLALNAAIEAARAGEHGRGFAVVAQEVKNLAGQSKEATGQIEDLIESIQKSSEDTVKSINLQYTEIQDGIESVKQTINALGNITGVVGEITEGMVLITQSTGEERIMMEQVMEGINLLNQESSENLEHMEAVSVSVEKAGDLTSEIADSSHDIANLAERLRVQADRFTLIL